MTRLRPHIRVREERARMCLAEIGGPVESVRISHPSPGRSAVQWNQIGELTSWRLTNIINMPAVPICFLCWDRIQLHNRKHPDEVWSAYDHCQCFGRPIMDCGIDRFSASMLTTQPTRKGAP